MPSPEQFLVPFPLYQGLTLNNFLLRNIDVEEQVLVPFNQYQYPILLVWEWQGSSPPRPEEIYTLIENLSSLLQGPRITYSDSGRHYLTFFLGDDDPQYRLEGKRLYLYYQGYAQRVSRAVAQQYL